jgi:amino-acid N-acetyltransferase
MNIFSSQVDLIREVFNYQSRFEGTTMVFKIDYPVIEDPGFPGLVKDLALLAKTGFKVIIVPGLKENIDAVLQQHDIDSSYTSMQGFPVRITSSQAISFVEMTAFNTASRFMTFLSGSRVDAVIGSFVRARGLGVINGIDTEHTGTVDKIYTDSLNKVLNLGMVPILPCVGWSPSGKPYNVPSDEIALAVSSALKAAKLFILSGHDGLKIENLNLPERNRPSLFRRSQYIDNAMLVKQNCNPSLMQRSLRLINAVHANWNSVEKLETRPDGSLIRLIPQQAEALIAANIGPQKSSSVPENELRQYMRELKLGLQASRAGVHRVHIINGREEGAVLKELFSNLGVGTMIYTDEHDSIRPLRSRDLPDVLRLMEPLMQKGSLIRRNPEQIQKKKGDYTVLEIDGSIRACAALHDWGEAQGEIAAVATDLQYTDLGLGRRLVDFLIEKARKNQMKRVFVLTTQTQDWFESIGFKESPVETLPEQKLEVYDKSRKSKVFALDL